MADAGRLTDAQLAEFAVHAGPLLKAAARELIERRAQSEGQAKVVEALRIAKDELEHFGLHTFALDVVKDALSTLTPIGDSSGQGGGG